MALLDIGKARTELGKSSMEEIERATAITWGGRAAASYDLAVGSESRPLRFRHFYEGENYRQEALEHSAMVEDRGRLLRQVHDEIEPLRTRARASLEDQPAPPLAGPRKRPVARPASARRGEGTRLARSEKLIEMRRAVDSAHRVGTGGTAALRGNGGSKAKARAPSARPAPARSEFTRSASRGEGADWAS